MYYPSNCRHMIFCLFSFFFPSIEKRSDIRRYDLSGFVRIPHDWISLRFCTVGGAEVKGFTIDGRVLIFQAFVHKAFCFSFADWVQEFVTSSWRTCSDGVTRIFLNRGCEDVYCWIDMPDFDGLVGVHQMISTYFVNGEWPVARSCLY